MSILFSKLIKCKNCGKNFKSKKLRSRRAYLCSSYDNLGECQREVIYEDFLVELLKRRYGEDFQISRDNIVSVVESIEVEKRDVFIINLKNDEPIEFGENFIHY